MTACDSYAPFIPEEDQGEKTIEPERETSKKEIHRIAKGSVAKS